MASLMLRTQNREMPWRREEECEAREEGVRQRQSEKRDRRRQPYYI